MLQPNTKFLKISNAVRMLPPPKFIDVKILWTKKKKYKNKLILFFFFFKSLYGSYNLIENHIQNKQLK